MIEAIAVIIFIVSAIFNAIRKSRAKTAATNTPDSAEVQRRRQEAYERAQREYAARAAQAQGAVPPGTTGAVGPVIMTAPVKTATVKTVAAPSAAVRAALPGRAPAPARAPLPGATRGQSAAAIAPKQSARPPQASPRRTIVAPNASTPMDASGNESFRRNVQTLENSEARALNIPLTDTPEDGAPQAGLAALQQRLAQNNPQTASLLSALILSQALGTPRAHGRAGKAGSPHPLA